MNSYLNSPRWPARVSPAEMCSIACRGTAFVALIALLSALLAPAAQANTPSTWSARFGSTPATAGTTTPGDAVEYADAISYGSGEVAAPLWCRQR